MLRRVLPGGRLAVLALLLALLAAAGAAHAAATVLFRDDGRTQWQQLFKLVGPTCNSITRSAASLRVTSCPVGGTGSRAAMVWAKRKLSGGIKIEFEYTHFSATPVSGGSMSGLMLFASGDGSAGWPTDVTTWGAQCCGNPSGYGPKTWGLQLNFASRNDPRGNTLMRLRGLKGTKSSYEEIGLSTPDFPFVNSRTYKFTVVRNGSKVTISVRDNVTNITKTLVANHPYIGSLKPGWVGFRQMAGRSSRFANLKISTGS
ncbi:MAG TPA: hypothetical protein PKA13_24950 [Geminicoccaceae bacterium]|nr:hypothetical protein [Geminicoccus sp.]HMU53046.1 hypothetical protein [Geminicoccaceae bacterium]